MPTAHVLNMVRYRHRVFAESPGWALERPDGQGLDQFDRADTLYINGYAENGGIVASARLLPTTSPYLLNTVYPELLGDLQAPNSPEVWELSRFAALDLSNQAAPRKTTVNNASVHAASLLRACMSAAASRGARRLITVSPVGVERLLRNAQVRAYRAGPPMVLGGHSLVACWIPIAIEQEDT